MSKTIIYLRSFGTATQGGAEHARNEQLRAATAAAIMAGCPVRRDSDGEPRLLNGSPIIEPISGSDKNLRLILEQLQPVDVLVVATLAVLGDVPSKMVANLSKAVATGARVIVADMSHLDVQAVRQIALAFLPLEQKAERLQAEIDGYYSSRSEERQQYAREIQRQVVDQLYKRGIDLSELLDPNKEAKPAVDDIRGRHLRQVRESLELSAEEAGKLVLGLGADKPLSKQDVSAIETGKSSAEKANLYETSLNAERGRRKVAAKMDQQIAKQSAHGSPLTAAEKEFLERVLKPQAELKSKTQVNGVNE